MLDRLKRLFGRDASSDEPCDPDLSRLMPPATVTDPGAWDQYWNDQLEFGLAPLVHMFVHDGVLVDVLRAHGLRTVLCVGNGISFEPHALARAGFDVTALDLSPLAMRLARDARPPADLLDGLIEGRAGEHAGALEFVTGDLCDRSLCPGPYDAIIERKTLQLFQGPEVSDAMQAVLDRLATPGLFFTHCHNGAWRPQEPRLHPLEDWLVEHGWPIWHGEAKFTGRVAVTFLSTG